MIVIGFVTLAALGTISRWQLGVRLPPPIGTLVVNLSGSLLFGLLARSATDSRTVLGVAGLGAFTTFSALVAELNDLWRETPVRAIAYGIATFVGGVGLAWIGIRIS